MLTEWLEEIPCKICQLETLNVISYLCNNLMQINRSILGRKAHDGKYCILLCFISVGFSENHAIYLYSSNGAGCGCNIAFGGCRHLNWVYCNQRTMFLSTTIQLILIHRTTRQWCLNTGTTISGWLRLFSSCCASVLGKHIRWTFSSLYRCKI